MGKIQALYVYPVKSCKGISVSSAIATPSGLQHDRQWMIVHAETGKFITQRTHPQMTQIKCALASGALALSFAGQSFSIPFNLQGSTIDSTVWRDTVQGTLQNINGLNEALSSFLDADVCLVKFADTRAVGSRTAPEKSLVQYADSYPYTIADTGDLKALNAFFASKDLPPIGIERFRSNIVLENVPVDVGRARSNFSIVINSGVVKGQFCEPCTRCPIPNIDPETGEKTDHKVSKNLKEFRNSEKDWFSTHSVLSLQNNVLISVGDVVTLEEK